MSLANQTISHRDRIAASNGSHDVKVLLYHKVISNGESDPLDIGVSEQTFRRQMQLLGEWGFTSITFEDYSLFLDGKLEYLPKKPVIVTFDDAYASIYDFAFPVLQEYGMKAVVFVLGDRSIRVNTWDDEPGSSASLINDQQILEMRAAGFEIGSHSLRHVRLTETSTDRAWEEISRSRMLLEILLDSEVRSFAYPYGLVNENIKRMAAEAGYSIACAAYSGPPRFCSDPYEIRRIKVANNVSPIRFWLQLQPVYVYFRWLIWKSKVFASALSGNGGPWKRNGIKNGAEGANS